ncbi:hypothetical protein NEF87_001179 [Candidatus Lokiarchaeum ossiferum]|uniref:Uncharacterized protein n=1 Tax=Candidatus Lokiarchaeum ossiferum TaxID=2951803 RepID=A0ABY6HQY9_9ARCH|nr:hypothetical protein NEF87_001179 [Candidatus Lokiarchaeum sp. B-35]
METPSFSIKQFLTPIQPLVLENVPVEIIIYSNFDPNSPKSIVQGIFRINIQKPTDEIVLQTKISSVTSMNNPFSFLTLTNTEENYSISFSCHRILSITLEGKVGVIVFMPHGTNPINGIPGEINVAWGEIRISGDEGQNAQILQNQIQNLYINNQVPRPRCSTCQGMKILKKTDLMTDFNENAIVVDENLVCQDCLNGAINYYSSLKTQIENLRTQDGIKTNKEYLLQLIDGGITLAENLNDEPFVMEFIILKIKVLQSSDEGEEKYQAKELLEEVQMFAENWNLSEITAKVEILQKAPELKEIDNIPSNNTKSLEKLDKDPTLLDEKKNEPMKAVSLKPVKLPKLSTPIKDIIIEEEVLPDEESLEQEEPKKKNLEFLKPEDIPVDEDAMALGEALDFTPSPDDLHIPLPEKQPEKSSQEKTLEFLKPEDIPVDEDAMALGEALDFTPSPDDLHIPLPEKQPGNSSQEKTLEFLKPEDIPVDEDAMALGEALDFTPSPDDLHIPLPEKQPEKSTQEKTLEFLKPEDIPVDEDAMALGEALDFTPTQEDLDEQIPKKMPQTKQIETNIPIAPPKVNSDESTFKSPPESDFDPLAPIFKKGDEKPSEIPINPLEVLDHKSNTKYAAGYQELNKGNLFFGIDRTKQKLSTSKDNSEKKPEIFSLFGGAPSKSSQESSSTSLDKEAISTEKLSPLSLRKNARQRRRNKVDICPMCGKIAPQCTCGYMKAKGRN